ncbi:MAG: hypothetical protein ACRES7_09175 [Gammaproteobacteria bacterium]
MDQTKHNATICIDVTLETNGNRVEFRYQGADETSRNHVAQNGDIDLCKSSALGRGPVDLFFRLRTAPLILEEIAYYPSFATRDSIWIVEAKCGMPVGTYRPRGIFACCGLRHPQFYGYSNPDSEPRGLRFSDRNDDGKEYKYTLRILAVGAQGSRWLEDDPKIKNGGGGTGQK